MREYVPKASNLLSQIWEDRNVRVNIVEKSYVLGRKKFTLIDMWLNGLGQEEDKKYVRSTFYRKNIRAGNTIIENAKNKYCQFARRGLPKILDIELPHVCFFSRAGHLDKSDRNIAEIIFQGVNLAFEDGKRVELIRSQKVNGLSAQISYDYDYDAWIIGSKNVSILASVQQDTQVYKQSRHSEALVIAQEWFRLIKALPKQKISELKKLLDKFTAVGEYCGNSKYQDLIRYEEVGLRWFALVDNLSEEPCIDPLKAKREFQKFGFKVASMKSIILTSSSEAFYTALEKLFLKTAEAGIEDTDYGMEGPIVYFVVPEPDKNGIGRQITVGAGNLKTLEYRFFSRIRQIVSKHAAKREGNQEIIAKFRQEMGQLETENNSRAPFPHDYYAKVLSSCIQVSDSASLKAQDESINFLSILKMVFYGLYKRISFQKHSKSMLSDKAFMDKIIQIPFLKYSGLGCNTKIVYIVVGLPGMFKSYLAHQLSAHFQKINVQYTILQVEKTQNLQQDLADLLKKQTSPLEHFYLDGSFDPESVFKIIKHIHDKGDHGSFYKIILIKDEIRSKFICSDENQYPFNLQTIVMCYFGQHQQKINSSRLQDKINNLKIVTEKLRKNANFNEITGKLSIQSNFYPFSQKCKLQNLEQFRKIIQNILKCQDEKSEFNAYALLILRLQQMEGVDYLPEDIINNEVEHLIKASYPSIPLINFKK